MNTEIWINKELDLKSALEKEEFDSLINYSGKNKNHILLQWINHDFSNLEKTLRVGSSIMRFFERNIQKSPILHAVFRLGTLCGTVEDFDELLSEKVRNDHVEKNLGASLSSIKHLDQIVKALEKKGPLNHSQLSAELKMEKSTLTEAMKKIEPTSVILSYRLGKYKLYSLSDIGHRYGNQLIRKESDSIDETELLLHIEKHLSSFKDEIPRENFTKKVKKMLEPRENINNSYKCSDSMNMKYPQKSVFAKLQNDPFSVYNDLGLVQSVRRGRMLEKHCPYLYDYNYTDMKGDNRYAPGRN